MPILVSTNKTISRKVFDENYCTNKNSFQQVSDISYLVWSMLNSVQFGGQMSFTATTELNHIFCYHSRFSSFEDHSHWQALADRMHRRIEQTFLWLKQENRLQLSAPLVESHNHCLMKQDIFNLIHKISHRLRQLIHCLMSINFFWF